MKPITIIENAFHNIIKALKDGMFTLDELLFIKKMCMGIVKATDSLLLKIGGR